MESDSRIIEGRARDIILRVNKYFENERDNCKGVLHALNEILNKTEAKKVPIPTELLSTVVNHLRNTTRVGARVTAATNVNKNTLTKILREGEQAKLNKTKLQTPIKRPRGKKKFFDSTSLEKLKIIIREQKSGITLKKLVDIARDDLKYTGSQSTLRRIIYDLGCQVCKSDGEVKFMSPNETVKHGEIQENLDVSNYSTMDVNRSIKKELMDIKTNNADNDFSEEEMLEEYLEFDDKWIDESENDTD